MSFEEQRDFVKLDPGPPNDYVKIGPGFTLDMPSKYAFKIACHSEATATGAHVFLLDSDPILLDEKKWPVERGLI